MRLRRRKNLTPRLEEVSRLFLERSSETNEPPDWPESLRVVAELGCGLGGFITEKAKRQPDTLHVALERNPNALVRAMELAAGWELPNLRFVLDDVQNLERYFAPGALSGLYINFCNPWPAQRHCRRRLTHPGFLSVYGKLLRPGGLLQFKTDDGALFAYSRTVLLRAGWTLDKVTEDLHGAGPRPEDDVMTEYEQRFREKGMPIFRLEAIPPA